MTPKDEDLPALQEFEAAIVQLWKKHPEMSDHAARRAYDNTFQHYRSIMRGHQPKPCTDKGVDLEAFNALVAKAESLRADRQVPVEKLVDLLRELSKSVERHTATQGRQGYLTFIKDFV